jgi:hypothetical protein
LRLKMLVTWQDHKTNLIGKYGHRRSQSARILHSQVWPDCERGENPLEAFSLVSKYMYYGLLYVYRRRLSSICRHHEAFSLVELSSVVADVALGKIRFSPPPPLSLAEVSRRGGVQRYRDNGYGRSDSGCTEIQ